MAESVTQPPAGRQPLVDPAQRHGSHTYRRRFVVAYGALGLVVGAAVAALVAVVVAHGPAPSAAWSAWQPKSGSRLDQASQIAARVAPEYRLASGDQLVAVQAHAPEVQNVPIEDVAVRGASGSSKDIKISSAQNALVYVLCGLGPRCAIASGTPSVQRARLLRREALELALYTFKYVGGVDSVVAMLPPPPTKQINWALYFHRSDFSQELSQPLARTLPAPPGGKLTPDGLGSAQSTTIERLTRPYWFTSSYQQLQDGNAILVLDPLIAAR